MLPHDAQVVRLTARRGWRVGSCVDFSLVVLREGMAGVPVRVELGGATEFALEVSDAGDGISCDQADWAEAQAVLNDGTVIRLETKLWFYFLGVSFIDAGLEAIHFGQTELMNHNDRNLEHYAQVLALVRSYAAKHARRHMVVCDSHVPSGGLVRDGKLLMDFHSFPLRIMEVPDKPQDAVLKVGFSDGIYGRSKGGLTFSGWQCEHLPCLVEIDNRGVSRQPGQPRAGGCWEWGYDEITWFAHQSKEYRANWLRYAWDWARRTDPNGYLHRGVPARRSVYYREGSRRRCPDAVSAAAV